MKILVTGAGSLLGQGIIRTLKKIDINFHIIAVDINPYSAGLYWTNEKFIIPNAKSPSYLQSIKKLLFKTKPDFLFIGTDVELLCLAQNKKNLEEEFNTKIIVSNLDVIKIADDKFKTKVFLKENGFDYPETVDPDDQNSLNNLIKTKGFPLIIKPRVGARSIQVKKVENKVDLYIEIKKITSPIVQEYIGSDLNEYTASALCFENKCDALIILRRDLRDGNSYRTYFVENNFFENKVREWAEALNPFGPVNFQFRVNEKGNPVVFEINARFSGTTPLRAIMGFNEVEMCIRKIAYNQDIIQPKIKDYTIIRHWSETAIVSSEPYKIKKI
jgi:carbamoyl-phosphate synthase large subunit